MFSILDLSQSLDGIIMSISSRAYGVMGQFRGLRMLRTNAIRAGVAAFWVLYTTVRIWGADPVLEWNQLLLEAIRADNSPPTLASRNLAILHTAIYDAVNSVEPVFQPYRFQLPLAGETSPEAAAVGAAHVVLVVLYPQLRARSDDEYRRFLASALPGAALTNGLALGRLVAALTVESRTSDGSSTQVPYIPDDSPGQWRRTPPFFRSPLDPHWGLVEPFCLSDVEAFMPPGPPSMQSIAYADDFNMVKALGGKRSALRTAEQAEIAEFWSDFSYTQTPPGHWQDIAAAIARSRGHSLAANARLFALLSLAQADAAIVVWEAKYRSGFWRPVTAIQRAGEDGNPATEPDVNWESFLVTPPFPEYVSGHSTFSTASAVVLSRFFGTDDVSFRVGSDSLPGVFRQFTSLTECANEVGLSRIYGGIHFMSANQDGKSCGAKIGEFVFRNFLLSNAALPWLHWESATLHSLTLRLHGRIGTACVLETSEDLLSWRPMSAYVAAVGGIALEVSKVQLAQAQFLRVREGGEGGD